MSSNKNIHGVSDTSYAFFDEQQRVRILLYAPGVVEVKDLDIAIDTDSLEVHLPSMSSSYSMSMLEQIFAIDLFSSQ
jgi:hypothetical protein